MDRHERGRRRPSRKGAAGLLSSTAGSARRPRRSIAGAHEALIDWFDPRRRLYPWRIRPTPYRVLVSEVMLQQTQAPRVIAPYRSFMKRFPSVRALADASAADVIRQWRGLGYNRRAVALSRAARVVVADHRGRIPADVVSLQRLPGIGPYTAAAVAVFGHGRVMPLVETNVRRVLARIEDVPERDVQLVAERWLDREHPSDWNQALMDLGRDVCRPSRPRCGTCPLRPWCGSSDRPVLTVPRSRQPAFQGSSRQIRGLVVAELVGARSRSIASLAEAVDAPLGRVAGAVRALARDGLVAAGDAALAGAPSGRVRLAR